MGANTCTGDLRYGTDGKEVSIKKEGSVGRKEQLRLDEEVM